MEEEKEEEEEERKTSNILFEVDQKKNKIKDLRLN
jgi:hypothetical protein